MAKGIDEQELAAVKRLRDELERLPPTPENRAAVAAADLLIGTTADLLVERKAAIRTILTKAGVDDADRCKDPGQAPER